MLRAGQARAVLQLPYGLGVTLSGGSSVRPRTLCVFWKVASVTDQWQLASSVGWAAQIYADCLLLCAGLVVRKCPLTRSHGIVSTHAWVCMRCSLGVAW
jgi:hypothetical protein